MKKVTTKEAENSYFKRSIPCKGALNRHIYHIFRSTVRTLKNTIARLWDGYLLIFVKADLLLKEVFETCDELSLEIERQNVENVWFRCLHGSSCKQFFKWSKKSTRRGLSLSSLEYTVATGRGSNFLISSLDEVLSHDGIKATEQIFPEFFFLRCTKWFQSLQTPEMKPKVQPLKWNLSLSSTFLWCCLLCCTRWF